MKEQSPVVVNVFGDCQSSPIYFVRPFNLLLCHGDVIGIATTRQIGETECCLQFVLDAHSWQWDAQNPPRRIGKKKKSGMQ